MLAAPAGVGRIILAPPPAERHPAAPLCQLASAWPVPANGMGALGSLGSRDPGRGCKSQLSQSLLMLMSAPKGLLELPSKIAPVLG